MYHALLNLKFHIQNHMVIGYISLNSLSTRDEAAEFANSIDLDEVAHYEPPHLDQHCLLSIL